MLFLLKIYQLFHSCEDNPEIVVIILVQAEPELWGTEKKKSFSSTEWSPATADGSSTPSEEHPSPKRLDWGRQHLDAAFFLTVC